MVLPTLAGSLGLLAFLHPALAAIPAAIKAENPSAKTECQQNVDDHGEIYISPSSQSQYKLACNVDHYGGDLDHAGSESFLGCIGVCDANPDCIGYAYTPGNCWLKKTFTRREVSTNVDFAINVQRNLTAAPYMEPPKPKPTTGSCGYYDDRDFPLGSKDPSAPPSEYQYHCGRDHPEGDIGVVGAKSFDSCVGFCDTTKDCIGFAWVGGNGPGTCYLKGRITPGEANANVDFASKNLKPKVETSTAVVASTSVVVSTSVSVVAPPPSSASSPPPPPASSEQAPPPPPASSSIVIPETPSESSTALATVTETRTKWSLTGSSSVPVATVTSKRIIFSQTGFATVPVVKTVKSSKSSVTLPSFSRSSLKSRKSQDGSKTVTSAGQPKSIMSMTTPTCFSTVPVAANTTSAQKTKNVIFALPPLAGVPDWAASPLNAPGPVPTNDAGEPDANAPKSLPGNPGPRPGVGYRIPYFPPFVNPLDIWDSIRHRSGQHSHHRDHRDHRNHRGHHGHHGGHGVNRVAETETDATPTLNAAPEVQPQSGHGVERVEAHIDAAPKVEHLGNYGVNRVAKTHIRATPTSEAPAPLLTDEPFSMRLNQSATSSRAGGIVGVLQGEGKPSAASNTSDDEPESTYISAPMITRAIPTLDAETASESVLEITETSYSTSKDLPEETYVAMPLIAEPPTATMIKSAKATKLPCQALREQRPKVLRTSVLAGNIDFDNLFVEQWQPSSRRTSHCSSKEARNGECRKFSTLHHQQETRKEKITNQTQANPTSPAPSSSPPTSKKPANTSCSPATASSPPGSAPTAATSPACR